MREQQVLVLRRYGTNMNRASLSQDVIDSVSTRVQLWIGTGPRSFHQLAIHCIQSPLLGNCSHNCRRIWYEHEESLFGGSHWRRGERGGLSGERNARQAGFEDRSRHRPRSSSSLIYRALTAIASTAGG